MCSGSRMSFTADEELRSYEKYGASNGSFCQILKRGLCLFDETGACMNIRSGTNSNSSGASQINVVEIPLFQCLFVSPIYTWIHITRHFEKICTNFSSWTVQLFSWKVLRVFDSLTRPSLNCYKLRVFKNCSTAINWGIYCAETTKHLFFQNDWRKKLPRVSNVRILNRAWNVTKVTEISF